MTLDDVGVPLARSPGGKQWLRIAAASFEARAQFGHNGDGKRARRTQEGWASLPDFCAGNIPLRGDAQRLH